MYKLKVIDSLGIENLMLYIDTNNYGIYLDNIEKYLKDTSRD